MLKFLYLSHFLQLPTNSSQVNHCLGKWIRSESVSLSARASAANAPNEIHNFLLTVTKSIL